MDQAFPSEKRFLCVDLDEGFFYLIRSYSERSGCLAYSLARGKESLEHIKQTPPDVFILEADDWNNDPAWEFIKWIQDDKELRSIPILLFSWLDDEETALEKGADFFVRKPVMLANFQDALNSVGICIERPSLEPVQEKKEVNKK
jgi:CheY-like chemotaxis protein